MRKAIRRILFYIRYEMTSDVKMRIEMTSIVCVILSSLGVISYQFYHLHKLEEEITRERAEFFETMKQLNTTETPSIMKKRTFVFTPPKSTKVFRISSFPKRPEDHMKQQ